MTEDATNPVDVEDDAILDAPEVDAESYSDDDTQAETEGAEDGQPEDDAEDVDYEGAKYRVPKVLKDALLRQADYTRKTQELADQRRHVEQHVQSLSQQAELQQATLEHRVNLRTVEQQLQQFQNTDWQAYSANYGADATASAMASWQQYRDAKAELEGAIAKTETEVQQISERSTANAIAEAEKVLSREIEGWSSELVTTLAGYAAENFGITPQELRDSVVNPDGTADPRTFKVLARLYKAETELAKLKAQNTKAQQAAKQAAVTPAKAVGQRAGGYEPGLNDKLPTDEWVRRRNAQVAKAAAR
ncbi:MAG: hypothetical protein INF04_04210 [Phenylobacterium sp.]|nr:hypothetical protein [Phenylobacterium sp.]MCA6236821.1 hypothetical protein [Phenylobacterium sp.]